MHSCTWFFLCCTFSYAPVDGLIEIIHSCIGHICFIFLSCVFSYSSSDFLLEMMHSYTGHICLVCPCCMLTSLHWLHLHFSFWCLTKPVLEIILPAISITTLHARPYFLHRRYLREPPLYIAVTCLSVYRMLNRKSQCTMAQAMKFRKSRFAKSVQK